MYCTPYCVHSGESILYGTHRALCTVSTVLLCYLFWWGCTIHTVLKLLCAVYSCACLAPFLCTVLQYVKYRPTIMPLSTVINLKSPTLYVTENFQRYSRDMWESGPYRYTDGYISPISPKMS